VVNGNMTTDLVVIQEHIVNCYKQLYFEQYMWRSKVDGLSFLPMMRGREFEE
jgi:hypothetical protein